MSEYFDDFSYPDGPVADNEAWINTIGGGLEVFSEEVAEDPGSGFQASSIDPAFMVFHADGEASVTIKSLTSFDWVGAGYRTTTNNGYFVVNGDGEYRLIKIVAGVETELGTNSTTPAVGHIPKIKCAGTTISAELDTGSGFTEIISVTDTDLTSGQPGGCSNRGNVNGSRIDDFYAIDVNGAGSVFSPVWAINANG